METTYDYPWKHVIIDDYLLDSEYTTICLEIKNFIKTNKAMLKQQTLLRSDDNLQRYLPQTYAIVKDKSILPLLKYFDNYRSSTTYSEFFEINICFNNLTYKIHDEASYKTLSLVTYLLPEKATGTLLYNQHKEFVKEVNWKPKQSLVFAAIDGVTWHNYRCDVYRITLNRFVTNDTYSR